MDRRTFLKSSLGAAGATAVVGMSSAAAEGDAALHKNDGTIPTRILGKTGLAMPVLGHGGSAIMADEYPYYGLTDVPSHEARVAMIRHAFDKGIRYFDTARIYRESEQLFGEALKDVKDQVYLASKVLVYEPEKVRESVETSLRTLQMDAIDCMQIHGPSIERLKYDGAMKLHEELVKLREEGLFRFIGMTGHNAFDEMYKMIASGGFDTVLIEYGHFRKGYNTRHSETMVEWRDACLAKAHEMNVGIVAMKVLGAWVYNHNSRNMVADFGDDRLKQLPGAAIRWALNDPRVSVLNIGVSYADDMAKNIAIVTGDTTFTLEDRMLLAEFASRAYLHESIQKLPVV